MLGSLTINSAEVGRGTNRSAGCFCGVRGCATQREINTKPNLVHCAVTYLGLPRQRLQGKSKRNRTTHNGKHPTGSSRGDYVVSTPVINSRRWPRTRVARPRPL